MEIPTLFLSFSERLFFAFLFFSEHRFVFEKNLFVIRFVAPHFALEKEKGRLCPENEREIQKKSGETPKNLFAGLCAPSMKNKKKFAQKAGQWVP